MQLCLVCPRLICVVNKLTPESDLVLVNECREPVSSLVLVMLSVCLVILVRVPSAASLKCSSRLLAPIVRPGPTRNLVTILLSGVVIMWLFSGIILVGVSIDRCIGTSRYSSVVVISVTRCPCA